MSRDNLFCLLLITIPIGIMVSLTPLFISQISLGQQQKGNTTIPPNTGPVGNFKLYNNAAFGITMRYPANWIKLDLSVNSSGVLVIFRSQIQAPAGSLNIIANNINIQNLTFSKLVSTNTNKLKQSGDILNLISQTSSSLAGYPAYEITYTTMSRGIKLQTTQLISLIGNKSYIITYAAPFTSYSTYLPTIHSMIDSIIISK